MPRMIARRIPSTICPTPACKSEQERAQSAETQRERQALACSADTSTEAYLHFLPRAAKRPLHLHALPLDALAHYGRRVLRG